MTFIAILFQLRDQETCGENIFSIFEVLDNIIRIYYLSMKGERQPKMAVWHSMISAGI